MNPKDLIGAKKAPVGVVPPALMLGAAEAMQTGAVKYGPFNYRENKVQAVTYYEAIQRHLFAWFDGQEVAEDTGVHHLHHVAAGIGILLDALHGGNLIDNRPVKGPAADILRAQDHSAPAQGAPVREERRDIETNAAAAALDYALDMKNPWDRRLAAVGLTPEDAERVIADALRPPLGGFVVVETWGEGDGPIYGMPRDQWDAMGAAAHTGGPKCHCPLPEHLITCAFYE